MKIDKKSVVITTVMLILFSSCASNRSGSTEERGSKDMPSWALDTPTADNMLYAVGQAKKQNPSLAKKTAVGRARSEIPQQITVKVSTLFTDNMGEVGIEGNAKANESTENVIKQVSNNVLNGSKVTETYVAKDGTVYVLAEYSLDLAKEEALKALKKEDALYNELKAKQGLEALEEAIKNMK
jgi:hypothetical protein|tara:strand:- start:48 stop:596 length:549 start_codon:yes stop_codon:yes gene_type:complete